MDIEIKKMTKSHLTQIKDILQEQFDPFWNAEVLDQELENPLSTYIVALQDKEVVGYAGLWQPIEEGHITNIVTRIDKRRNQVASKMLEAIIQIAKKKQLTCITLEVNVNNENAIKLYQKYHFQEVGRRKKYYHNKEDAYIMTLALV